MRGLKDTIALLNRSRKVRPAHSPARRPSRMEEVTDFSPNPGRLRMLLYRPRSLPAGAPLVVVLHGCTQSAEGYAEGAGWLTLADRLGFAVLAPEQSSANNPNLCFNWFSPNAVKRGHGEVASVRNMIGRALATHDLDRERVFVTGLSAGGAMAAALLAAYPEVFAAGAVVAGLPVGAASNVPEAFAAMSASGPRRDAAAWAAAVRAASDHAGPWPRVSIWHGDADATVGFANAEALAAQWSTLHGLAAHEADLIAGHRRQTWSGKDGLAAVEFVTIGGMGHGTPLCVGGPEGCGAAGPFLIEAGVSSSLEIARFFRIAGEAATGAQAEYVPPPPDHIPARHFDPGEVIAKALRSAGLMR